MKALRIALYVFGLVVGVGCIVFPLVTHAATNGTVALIIFGVALIAATLLIIRWNKAGKPKAGAGDVDTGASAEFVRLDDGEWLIIFIILGVGVAGAVIAGAVIHG